MAQRTTSMRIKLVLLLAIPPLLGISAFGLISGRAGQAWRKWAMSQPIIEYPSNLDLGRRQVGEVVVSTFSVINRGNGGLIIDEIESNCACAGLEREVDGKLVRVESLCIQPGEKVELALRLIVKGRPGTSMETAISFRTNDPSYPTATIHPIVSWVSGGISTEPTTVLFGRLVSGAVAKQVIEIWDYSAEKRAIKQVNSTAPKRVATQKELQPS
jgi:hypothetical protein